VKEVVPKFTKKDEKGIQITDPANIIKLYYHLHCIIPMEEDFRETSK